MTDRRSAWRILDSNMSSMDDGPQKNLMAVYKDSVAAEIKTVIEQVA